MKYKFKTSGETLKGLIKTGGDVAEKALDKGSEVATVMMNNMTGLVSKLSNDIGVMANRVLTMEERIGLMADRILKTEALMARLTATLANKNLDISFVEMTSKDAFQAPILTLASTEASEGAGPQLTIAGDPEIYLLYVSTSPLFQSDSTVVTQINDANDYNVAWRRSINAIRGVAEKTEQNRGEAFTVSVAVKTIVETNQLSALSNSIDVTVCN